MHTTPAGTDTGAAFLFNPAASDGTLVNALNERLDQVSSTLALLLSLDATDTAPAAQLGSALSALHALADQALQCAARLQSRQEGRH